MQGASFPYGPVNDMKAVFEDEQVNRFIYVMNSPHCAGPPQWSREDSGAQDSGRGWGGGAGREVQPQSQ